MPTDGNGTDDMRACRQSDFARDLGLAEDTEKDFERGIFEHVAAIGQAMTQCTDSIE